MISVFYGHKAACVGSFCFAPSGELARNPIWYILTFATISLAKESILIMGILIGKLTQISRNIFTRYRWTNPKYLFVYKCPTLQLIKNKWRPDICILLCIIIAREDFLVVPLFPKCFIQIVLDQISIMLCNFGRKKKTEVRHEYYMTLENLSRLK